jgi:hypothetical protein
MTTLPSLKRRSYSEPDPDGAQLFLTPRWTLLAKFDGEFANGSQTYGGSGTLLYT